MEVVRINKAAIRKVVRLIYATTIILLAWPWNFWLLVVPFIFRAGRRRLLDAGDIAGGDLGRATDPIYRATRRRSEHRHSNSVDQIAKGSAPEWGRDPCRCGRGQ